MKDIKKQISLVNFTKNTIPLLISSLSSCLMITIDRLMIARHQLEAMAAVGVVGTLIFTFELGFQSITSISSVYCGQYFGAANYKKVAIAVWQMLYFCIYSIIIFYFLSEYTGEYLIQKEYHKYGLDFYKILMQFLWLGPAYAAISGFFVGISEVKIISIISLISNILNIILDYILIFGFYDIIEPQGVKGAAIGTVISLFVQFFLAFSYFLSSKFNLKFNTRDYRWNYKLFKNCFNTALPNAINYSLELLSNYIVLILITSQSSITVSFHLIGINFYILIISFIKAIEKNIIGLASNILGMNKINLCKILLRNSIKLHFIITIFLIFLAITFSKNWIEIYSGTAWMKEYSKELLLWAVTYYFFDSLAWIISSFLVAGGDTKFLMISSQITIWTVRVGLLIFLIKINYISLFSFWHVSVISSIILLLILSFRFIYGSWVKINIEKLND